MPKPQKSARLKNIVFGAKTVKNHPPEWGIDCLLEVICDMYENTID